MTHDTQEIARRTTLALSAIKRAISDDKPDSGVLRYVTHHLAELDAGYWEKHAGTSRPNANQVLGLLVLQAHWGEEDEHGIDTFDFTLPGEVTDYLLTVHFDKNGQIDEVISMES